MKKRCKSECVSYYRSYKERGVSVCNEWENSFISFYEWAVQNGYSNSLTIDRIDNDGNYCPANCRWVTKDIQNRNTRKLQIKNTSGYRGVSFHKKSQKWQSYIKVMGKTKYLGIHNNPFCAAMAYDAYVIKHNLEHTINIDMR